jgi:hypothetical protein
MKYTNKLLLVVQLISITFQVFPDMHRGRDGPFDLEWEGNDLIYRFEGIKYENVGEVKILHTHTGDDIGRLIIEFSTKDGLRDDVFETTLCSVDLRQFVDGFINKLRKQINSKKDSWVIDTTGGYSLWAYKPGFSIHNPDGDVIFEKKLDLAPVTGGTPILPKSKSNEIKLHRGNHKPPQEEVEQEKPQTPLEMDKSESISFWIKELLVTWDSVKSDFVFSLNYEGSEQEKSGIHKVTVTKTENYEIVLTKLLPEEDFKYVVNNPDFDLPALKKFFETKWIVETSDTTLTFFKGVWVPKGERKDGVVGTAYDIVEWNNRENRHEIISVEGTRPLTVYAFTWRLILINAGPEQKLWSSSSNDTYIIYYQLARLFEKNNPYNNYYFIRFTGLNELVISCDKDKKKFNIFYNNEVKELVDIYQITLDFPRPKDTSYYKIVLYSMRRDVENFEYSGSSTSSFPFVLWFLEARWNKKIIKGTPSYTLYSGVEVIDQQNVKHVVIRNESEIRLVSNGVESKTENYKLADGGIVIAGKVYSFKEENGSKKFGLLVSDEPYLSIVRRLKK